MGTDEAGTLTALKSHQAECIGPAIAERGGRIVKLMGDGVLAEFASVLDAVDCAVTIQREIKRRNAAVPEDLRVAFRIGVNLGDLIIDGDDIYGDGVNVAARLESLAETGGVCISGKVFEEVANKLGLGVEDMGERELKNINKPVRAYRVVLEPSGVNISPRPFPSKPSIAVLPFENMSGDPEQEYFADGISEDIITALSKFHWLFVIARNSTFAYKGRAVDLKVVARDLGVRYVLEGSVRSAAGRIRVTGQLIDAEAGNHLWAQRYDRELADIFALQDEITDAIVAAIEPEVGAAERARALRSSPGSLDAWFLYQKGLAAYYSSTAKGFKDAIDYFDRVNTIDPEFALAFAMGSEARFRFAANWSPEQKDLLQIQAAEKVQRAIALDPGESMCLAADARVRGWQGEFEIAVAKANQAVALNPNNALAQHIRGVVLVMAHRPQEAIESFDEAIRLSPNNAFMAGFQMVRAGALFQMARYEEAAEWARLSVHSAHPRPIAFAILAASLCELSRRSEAQPILEQLYERQPNFRIGGISEIIHRIAGAKFAEALRKAGVPA